MSALNALHINRHEFRETERNLLGAFLFYALNSGSALSNGRFFLTLHDFDQISGTPMYRPVFQVHGEPVRTDRPAAEQSLFQYNGAELQECVERAVFALIDLTVDWKTLTVHRTFDPGSAGITWGWLRQQNVLGAVIAQGAAAAPFIERQELKVAEAIDRAVDPLADAPTDPAPPVDPPFETLL